MLAQDSEHDHKLNQYISDLGKMPMTAFMRVLSSAKETLRNILVRGEYSDYPDEEKMHGKDRLTKMLNKCMEELQAKSPENRFCGEFLMEEIKVLEEARGIQLPYILPPHTAFLTVFQEKVNQLAASPGEFMEKVWNYVEEVVVRVIMEKSESYLQLQSHTRRVSHNLISKMKTQSLDLVKEMVKMEKFVEYRCSP